MPLTIEHPLLEPPSMIDVKLTVPDRAYDHGSFGLDHNPMLQPSVPEPAEYAVMFAFGLVCLVVTRRLRRKHASKQMR